jgi:hypothetical protein
VQNNSRQSQDTNKTTRQDIGQNNGLIKLRHQAIFMISVGLEKKIEKNIFCKEIIFDIILSETVFLPYIQL